MMTIRDSRKTTQPGAFPGIRGALALTLGAGLCLASLGAQADGATYRTLVTGNSRTPYINVEFNPDPALAGQTGNVYVSANVGGTWFFKTAAGWQAWQAGQALPVYKRGPLQSQVITLSAGDVDVSGLVGLELYVGYGLNDADLTANKRTAKVHTVRPNNLQVISRKSYDGVSDDLLTAGLGQTGIGSATAPSARAGFSNSNPADIRQLAIYNNYRALVDATPAGGFGTLYGPNVGNDGTVPLNKSTDGRIAGDEVLGLYDPGDGSEMVTLMVQIPKNFDLSHPCLVTATSSGSRGIYGAIGTAGDWGLKQGCAVAYNDKGSGNGGHGLENGNVTRAEGALYGVRTPAFDAANNLVVPFPQFVARDGNGNPIAPGNGYNKSYPNRYAFKHAHSGVNPETSWGQYVLASIRFAINALNEKYAGLDSNGLPRAIFAPRGTEGLGQTGVTVIASSVSNGGGSALRAAEQDADGLITGIAVSEPQVQPDLTGKGITLQSTGVVAYTPQLGRSLFDYVTLYTLYQPCASLANPQAPWYANLNGAGQQANRCKSLAKNGLLGASVTDFDITNATALGAAASAAQNVLYANGILAEQAGIAPSYEALRTHAAVAVTYANAYGRFRVTDNVCGYSFAPTDSSGNVTPVSATGDLALFATGNGIPPTGGINLVANLSASGMVNDNLAVSASTGIADINFDGALCLRKLATGVDPITGSPLTGALLAQYQRVQAGIAEVRANGNLRGKPAIIVHGRSDGLIPPNHASRAYLGLNKVVEGNNSRLSYVEVLGGHHLDTLNSLYPTQTIPLHVYLVRALNALYANLTQGTDLPPSQVVRPSFRAAATETLTATKLPAIAANPASSDRITVVGTTVTVPQ